MYVQTEKWRKMVKKSRIILLNLILSLNPALLNWVKIKLFVLIIEKTKVKNIFNFIVNIYIFWLHFVDKIVHKIIENESHLGILFRNKQTGMKL